MTRGDLTELKKWFSRFVRGYQTEDLELHQNVDLKVQRTMNVCREIRFIGHAMSLSETDLLLAESIALLHDVGRFEQFSRYRTFADSRSEDHAQLGITIVSQERLLEPLPSDEADLIVRAVALHNRATVPRDESDRSLLFTNLLRDADKLDIWRIVIEYYYQDPGERNEAVAIGYEESPGISARITENLRREEPVWRRDVRNINDFKLLHIGWVYDLNFTPTYRAVRERRYIHSIAATLPLTPEVEEVVRIADAHLARKCMNDRQTLVSG